MELRRRNFSWEKLISKSSNLNASNANILTREKDFFQYFEHFHAHFVVKNHSKESFNEGSIIQIKVCGNWKTDSTVPKCRYRIDPDYIYDEYEKPHLSEASSRASLARALDRSAVELENPVNVDVKSYMKPVLQSLLSYFATCSYSFSTNSGNHTSERDLQNEVAGIYLEAKESDFYKSSRDLNTAFEQRVANAIVNTVLANILKSIFMPEKSSITHRMSNFTDSTSKSGKKYMNQKASRAKDNMPSENLSSNLSLSVPVNIINDSNEEIYQKIIAECSPRTTICDEEMEKSYSLKDIDKILAPNLQDEENSPGIYSGNVKYATDELENAFLQFDGNLDIEPDSMIIVPDTRVNDDFNRNIFSNTQMVTIDESEGVTYPLSFQPAKMTLIVNSEGNQIEEARVTVSVMCSYSNVKFSIPSSSILPNRLDIVEPPEKLCKNTLRINARAHTTACEMTYKFDLVIFMRNDCDTTMIEEMTESNVPLDSRRNREHENRFNSLSYDHFKSQKLYLVTIIIFDNNCVQLLFLLPCLLCVNILKLFASRVNSLSKLLSFSWAPYCSSLKNGTYFYMPNFTLNVEKKLYSSLSALAERSSSNRQEFQCENNNCEEAYYLGASEENKCQRKYIENRIGSFGFLRSHFVKYFPKNYQVDISYANSNILCKGKSSSSPEYLMPSIDTVSHHNKSKCSAEKNYEIFLPRLIEETNSIGLSIFEMQSISSNMKIFNLHLQIGAYCIHIGLNMKTEEKHFYSDIDSDKHIFFDRNDVLINYIHSTEEIRHIPCILLNDSDKFRRSPPYFHQIARRSCFIQFFVKNKCNYEKPFGNFAIFGSDKYLISLAELIEDNLKLVFMCSFNMYTKRLKSNGHHHENIRINGIGVISPLYILARIAGRRGLPISKHVSNQSSSIEKFVKTYVYILLRYFANLTYLILNESRKNCKENSTSDYFEESKNNVEEDINIPRRSGNQSLVPCHDRQEAQFLIYHRQTKLRDKSALNRGILHSPADLISPVDSKLKWGTSKYGRMALSKLKTEKKWQNMNSIRYAHNNTYCFQRVKEQDQILSEENSVMNKHEHEKQNFNCQLLARSNSGTTVKNTPQDVESEMRHINSHSANKHGTSSRFEKFFPGIRSEVDAGTMSIEATASEATGGAFSHNEVAEKCMAEVRSGENSMLNNLIVFTDETSKQNITEALKGRFNPSYDSDIDIEVSSEFHFKTECMLENSNIKDMSNMNFFVAYVDIDNKLIAEVRPPELRQKKKIINSEVISTIEADIEESLKLLVSDRYDNITGIGMVISNSSMRNDDMYNANFQTLRSKQVDILEPALIMRICDKYLLEETEFVNMTSLKRFEDIYEKASQNLHNTELIRVDSRKQYIDAGKHISQISEKRTVVVPRPAFFQGMIISVAEELNA